MQIMWEIAFFRANLHSWYKFYTTAGRDGRDKSQLCLKHILSGPKLSKSLVIVLKIIIHPVILLDYQKHDKSFSQGSTWTTTSGGKAERFHRESSFAIWFKFWILNLILHQFYNNVSQVL